jgi:hypothetical protein
MARSRVFVRRAILQESRMPLFLIALQQLFAVQQGGRRSAGGLRTGQAAGNA